MTDTIEVVKFEISSTCACMYCDTCDMGTEDEICGECKVATREVGWCDGACWEYKVEWLEEELEKWCALVGNPPKMKVSSRRMNWNGVSGYAIINPDFKSLLKVMSVGDQTLDFTFNGTEVSIVRYSHDEPMGATFIIEPSEEEE